jgi:hypothetical protein
MYVVPGLGSPTVCAPVAVVVLGLQELVDNARRLLEF